MASCVHRTPNFERVFQGGIKAVVWTDVLQMLLMIGGFAMVLISGIVDYGGLANLFRLAGEHGMMDLE